MARLNRGDVADDLLGEFSLAGRVYGMSTLRSTRLGRQVTYCFHRQCGTRHSKHRLRWSKQRNPGLRGRQSVSDWLESDSLSLTQRELGSVRHSSAATTRSSVVLRGIPRAIGRPEESDRAHDSALSTSTMDFGTRDQLPESAASEKKSSLGEHVEGCLWEMIHGEGLARKGR